MVIVLALSPGLTVAAATTSDAISVEILFDMGDGSYRWATATIHQPELWNATWNATLAAAEAADISLRWGWFDGFGVYLQGIGTRGSGFSGLFLWNRTAATWELTPVGISDLELRGGDSLAIYTEAFDPVTFAVRRPIPSPATPHPHTMFRGDLANTGASRSEAPDNGSVAWDHDSGSPEVGSSPAVAYGRVYINTMGGLLALDADTGAEVWRSGAVRGWSSPAVFDDGIFVGGSDGRVYMVNATTGREVWNVTLLTATQFSGITSSPKVDRERVYVGTFNESGGPGEVVALQASNGSVMWRHSTGSIHYSSAALTSDTLYIGVMGRYNTTTQVTFDPPYGLLALGLEDGREKRFFQTQGSVAASPLVLDSMVLVASKDGNLYALDHDGGLKWKAEVGAGTSSPAAGDGMIYVAGGGARGGVVALTTSGETIWSFQPNGPVQASLAFAEHKVFFSTNTARGRIYALNATVGSEQWSYEPSPPQYILGSPVVADGMVFAPSDNGHVYAFREGEPPQGGPDGGAGRSPVWTSPPLILLVAGVAVAALAAGVLTRRSRRAS